MVTQRLTLGIALALSAGALGACRAHVRASGTGHAHVEPVLVWVDGVWVVEDYHEPVFYHGNYYWRWYGGAWYRSSVHTGGWVRIDVVPDRVRRVERPEMYVRWKAEAGARRHTGSTPPSDEPEESVSDDRGHGPPDHAPAHGLHGTQPGHNKGDKAEMKEEKAEAKAEMKEEKAEAKAEMKAEKKADKAEKKADKAEVKADKAQEKADKAQEKADKQKDKAAKAEVKAEVKAEKAEKAKDDKGDKGGGGGKKDK